MCLRATVPTRQERNARAEERYEQRSLANFESAFADEGAFASTGSLGGTWGGASVASSAGGTTESNASGESDESLLHGGSSTYHALELQKTVARASFIGSATERRKVEAARRRRQKRQEMEDGNSEEGASSARIDRGADSSSSSNDNGNNFNSDLTKHSGTRVEELAGGCDHRRFNWAKCLQATRRCPATIRSCDGRQENDLATSAWLV